MVKSRCSLPTNKNACSQLGKSERWTEINDDGCDKKGHGGVFESVISS